MDRILTYKIEDGGMNVAAFLRKKGYSGSLIKHIKKTADGLTIERERVFTNRVLRAGESLRVKIIDREAGGVAAKGGTLDIVYEDEDLLVLDKPAGTPVHPVPGNRENTMANAVCAYYALQGQSFVFRAPQRLDRGTTGLIIVAKNPLSASVLFAMLKRQEIKREYLAIVKGRAPACGEIIAPISRDENSILSRRVDFERGEYAKTYFERLETAGGLSLLKVSLFTGRTHQIRVHLKHIGLPIIGDFLYFDDFERINRQALHCCRLGFNHPVSGAAMELYRPMPPDMQRAFYTDRPGL